MQYRSAKQVCSVSMRMLLHCLDASPTRKLPDVDKSQKLQLSTLTLQLQCLGHQDWTIGQNLGNPDLCHLVGGGEQ